MWQDVPHMAKPAGFQHVTFDILCEFISQRSCWENKLYKFIYTRGFPPFARQMTRNYSSEGGVGGKLSAAGSRTRFFWVKTERARSQSGHVSLNPIFRDSTLSHICMHLHSHLCFCSALKPVNYIKLQVYDMDDKTEPASTPPCHSLLLVIKDIRI